jgi:hypothetical protein
MGQWLGKRHRYPHVTKNLRHLIGARQVNSELDSAEAEGIRVLQLLEDVVRCCYVSLLINANAQLGRTVIVAVAPYPPVYSTQWHPPIATTKPPQ